MAFVRGLTDVLEARGIDRHTLLSGSPFAAQDLAAAPLQPIEQEQLDALVERAIALTADAAIGLHFWQRATFGAFGAVGHALSVAESFRAGIGLIERYWPLFMSEPLVEVHDESGLCTIQLKRKATSALAHRAYMEAGMFIFARFLRQCAGAAGVPRQARFDFPTPRDRAQYVAALGCPCEFDCVRSELVVADSDAQRANLNHAPDLSLQLRGIADDLLTRQAESPLSVRVLELWRASAEISRMSVELTAARLGMTERSMRRRLSAEGTSFPALVQRAQAELAQRLLRDPTRSVKEVAYALGFADPSDFQRALRRWTGKTPAELRGSGAVVSEPEPAPRRVPDQSGLMPIFRSRHA
jgi:AraC-like DNA-binding protein